MERSDASFPRVHQPPDPSAVRLARALADRLGPVLPAPFHVRAEGDRVSLYHGYEWDGSVGVPGALDEHVDSGAPAGERYSFAWYAATTAEGLLSFVQDGVAVTTKEQW